jgi:hypothetical protein
MSFSNVAQVKPPSYNTAAIPDPDSQNPKTFHEIAEESTGIPKELVLYFGQIHQMLSTSTSFVSAWSEWPVMIQSTSKNGLKRSWKELGLQDIADRDIERVTGPAVKKSRND